MDEQQRIHDTLADALEIEEGRILTGWVIVWETASLADERPEAGQMYGPGGMTTWRALGLVEWARRFCLAPDKDDDE